MMTDRVSSLSFCEKESNYLFYGRASSLKPQRQLQFHTSKGRPEISPPPNMGARNKTHTKHMGPNICQANERSLLTDWVSGWFSIAHVTWTMCQFRQLYEYADIIEKCNSSFTCWLTPCSNCCKAWFSRICLRTRANITSMPIPPVFSNSCNFQQEDLLTRYTTCKEATCLSEFSEILRPRGRFDCSQDLLNLIFYMVP